MIRTVLVAALLVAPLPALAQVAPGGPAQPVQATGPTTVKADVVGQPESGARQSGEDLNRRVCRKTATTGSRIAAAKVCKSAREWEQERIAAKTDLDRQQRPKGTNF